MAERKTLTPITGGLKEMAAVLGLFLLGSFLPLPAQNFLTDYLPLPSDKNLPEGFRLYGINRGFLYYQDLGEEVGLSRLYGEGGLSFSDGRIRANIHLNSDYAPGRGKLPSWENVDLIINHREQLILSDGLYAGGGGAWESDYLSARMDWMSGDVTGGITGRIPLLGPLTLAVTGEKVPLFPMTLDFLDGARLPLNPSLSRLEGKLLWRNDYGEAGALLGTALLTQSSPEPAGRGLWLSARGNSRFAGGITAKVSPGEGMWSFSLSASSFDVTGRGRLYTVKSDGTLAYDSFLETEESLRVDYWEGLLGYSRGILDLDGFWYCLLLDQPDAGKVTLSAPSTLVSASYVYRHFVEDLSGWFHWGGIGGAVTWGNERHGGRIRLGTSLFKGSAAYDGREISGLFIPFVSLPEESLLGRIEFEETWLISSLGTEWEFNWNRLTLTGEAEQLIPLSLNPSASSLPTEGGIGESLIWGGFRFSLGLSCSL